MYNRLRVRAAPAERKRIANRAAKLESTFVMTSPAGLLIDNRYLVVKGKASLIPAKV